MSGPIPIAAPPRSYLFALDQVRAAIRELALVGRDATQIQDLVPIVSRARAYLVDAEAALEDAITETPEPHGVRRGR